MLCWCLERNLARSVIAANCSQMGPLLLGTAAGGTKRRSKRGCSIEEEDMMMTVLVGFLLCRFYCITVNQNMNDIIVMVVKNLLMSAQEILKILHLYCLAVNTVPTTVRRYYSRE